MTIHKKIVTDEQMRPVAVQIDYADWLEIARRLNLESPPATIPSQEERFPKEDFGTLLKASRGIWKGGDGLAYQRRIRDEWTRPWDPEAQDHPSEET